MENVNRVLWHFKETARHLWNTSFWGNGNCDETAGFAFDDIEAKLFRDLVLRPLDIDWPEGRYRNSVVPKLRVVLRSAGSIDQLPVLTLSGEKPMGPHAWNIAEARPSELANLRFISFWGWDSFDFIDWPYIECLDPDVDRRILIECHYCDICLEE